MDLSPSEFGHPSRLKVLLDHLSVVEDDRAPHRVAYPLQEILLLSVCGTIADCDDYDDIAEWGAAHLDFLQRFLPYHFGVPTGRWLTQMMNRVNPALFSACFTDWVRACWPDHPSLVAIDGKTLRRSHDRRQDQSALHLVSAFACATGLVLGQEGVPDKANELTAIPLLLERLAENGGLKGAVVTIDAIACNGKIAQDILNANAHYLLAVKANQPTLRKDIETCFAEAPATAVDHVRTFDKGHGRIEQRDIFVLREVDWLNGARRFPGELRLPGVAAIVKVQSRTQLRDRCRFDTRYFVTSANLTAEQAADWIRAHWYIENKLHWVLDVTFDEDRSRLRRGHGAQNMAVVRHFALNNVRQAPEPQRPPRSGLTRKTNKPKAPTKTSIKRRRKYAGWSTDYLDTVLNVKIC